MEPNRQYLFYIYRYISIVYPSRKSKWFIFSRYISIVYPSRKSKWFTWTKTIICTVCIWIYAALTMIPVFLGWSRFTYMEPIYLCCFDWGYSMPFNIYIFFAGFGISTITICFCYVYIFKKVIIIILILIIINIISTALAL